MIVKAQIQKESYGFGTFTATRVAEIQSKTKPEEWWWVPGDLNPADLTTRSTPPHELDIDSTWQNGSAFMRQSIDEWPIVQECYLDNHEIPDVCPALTVSHSLKTDGNWSPTNLKFIDIDLSKFSSFTKLLRVTCIIIRICKRKSFRQNAFRISPDEIHSAEREWVRYIQSDILARKDWRTTYQRLRVELSHEGLIVVGSRMAEWLKATWNRTDFILLPAESGFSELYMRSIHDANHAGIELTLAKIRSQYWIPGARK